MNLIEQQQPDVTPIPGVAHATWAGREDGLTQLSVWRQTLAPGAVTPPHRHECDEVVMCLSGWGEAHSNGEVRRFGPQSTLTLPREQVHQLFNVGPMPLELVAVFADTPVRTWLPDGQALELPWRS